MATQDYEFISNSDEALSEALHDHIREAVLLQTMGLIKSLLDLKTLTNNDIMKIISSFAESTVEGYPEYPDLEKTVFEDACHVFLASLSKTEK